MSGFVTTSSAEASLLIWSRQECRSEETKLPIATHLRTTPKSWGTARPVQGSHNTGGKECLMLGHRTGISLTLLRDVSSDGVRPCQHVLLSQHRSHTTCRRNCSTSFHNKLNHGDGWFRMEISPLIQLVHSYHTVLSLSAPLSWHVLSGHSVWHGVHILSVASRRNAQSNRIAVVIRSTPPQS